MVPRWKTVQGIGKDEGGGGQKIQTEKYTTSEEMGFWYFQLLIKQYLVIF